MSHRRRKLIYVLGFMGCGKSTVGGLLAQELGWSFIDLDTTIEAGQGATVREIFDRAGEAFSREIERAALVEVSKTEPAIVALGGGTFVQKPNIEFIRETGGTTVWLDCPIQELVRRCEGKNDRPLFRDPLSFSRLLDQRLPYYQMADFRIPTEGRSPQEVVDQILCLNIR